MWTIYSDGDKGREGYKLVFVRNLQKIQLFERKPVRVAPSPPSFPDHFASLSPWPGHSPLTGPRAGRITSNTASNCRFSGFGKKIVRQIVYDFLLTQKKLCGNFNRFFSHQKNRPKNRQRFFPKNYDFFQ